jgi:hypothetical protein
LLKEIEKHPNELTFDSFGRIIIDEVGIPGSNIFVVFPKLFKARTNDSNLLGFNEIKKKLEEMGLSSYLKMQVGRGKQKPQIKQDSTFDPNFSANNQPWYYIGP